MNFSYIEILSCWHQKYPPPLKVLGLILTKNRLAAESGLDGIGLDQFLSIERMGVCPWKGICRLF